MRISVQARRTGRLCAVLSLVFLFGGAAVAAPLTGGGLRDRFAGAELRMSVNGLYYGFEHHLWRFSPDGTVHGQIRYVTSGRHSWHVEMQDRGTWTAEGDRICTEWQEFFWQRGNRVCFSVTQRAGSHVTIHTDFGRSWQGTLDPWRR